MYNFKNGNLPNIFLSMFESNAVYHQHETRQRHDFLLPVCVKLILQEELPGITGIIRTKIWNSIPENMRNCNTVSSFKHLCKHLILSRIVNKHIKQL